MDPCEQQKKKRGMTREGIPSSSSRMVEAIKEGSSLKAVMRMVDIFIGRLDPDITAQDLKNPFSILVYDIPLDIMSNVFGFYKVCLNDRPKLLAQKCSMKIWLINIIRKILLGHNILVFIGTFNQSFI